MLKLFLDKLNHKVYAAENESQLPRGYCHDTGYPNHEYVELEWLAEPTDLTKLIEEQANTIKKLEKKVERLTKIRKGK